MPFKILIAPLDWGLGHTTRCLPVIGLLLEQGHSVTLAAPEKINAFVKDRFPEIKTLPLHGYAISYAKKGFYFTAKIISQIPKIIKAIRKERQWLQQIQAKENFDLIISDNRYGLYHIDTQCVIMTHQLEIQTGWNHLTNQLLQKIHYRLLQKFNACWIVDNPEEDSLGGKLSHPKKLPHNARYIGLLSQFLLSPPKAVTTPAFNPQKKKILILLSGPEPMRGQLEKELKAQCQQLPADYELYFVAGKLGATTKPIVDGNLHYYSCLSGKELTPLLFHADLIICRSGYSTLMDIAFFEKRAILIPTPGQTEQEYLAKHLHKKLGVETAKQGAVNLQESIIRGLSTNPIQGFGNKKTLFLRQALAEMTNNPV